MHPSQFTLPLALACFAPTLAAQDSAPLRELQNPLLRQGAPAQLPPAPASSSPGGVQVIFTNIATSPTSDVPGLGGTKFMAGNITTAFEKQWVSPDGLHWAFRGDTALATTVDNVLIYSNVPGTPVLFEQEGSPTGFAPLENWGPGTNRLGINILGDLALTNNTSATVNDDYIARWNSGPNTWTILAQEAGAIAALPPTVTWDDAIDSISLLDDSRVAFRATAIDGTGIVPGTNDQILVLDTTLVARSGVTIPLGQAGGAADPWQNFTVDNYYVSHDGLHVLIDGDTTNVVTTADDMTSYDGTVVVQEGVVLPGSGFVSPVAAGGVAEVAMDAGGRWYARGNNVDTSQDWVLRNGVVIAKTDDPIGVSRERVYMHAVINQAQETPPSGSAATGTGDFLVNTETNQLWYDINLTGVVGESAAELRGYAMPGGFGASFYTLPLGTPKRGVINYMESEEPFILADLAYVEIHTAAFPPGEIRGQVLNAVETWDDTDFTACFFAHTGNAVGDYIVAGVTSAPFDVNGVIVLNGSTVLVREGDPVDVNGNGLFDDDAYYQNFGNDDCTLLEDGTLYFSATLRNGAGTAFAQGIFKRSPGSFKRALCFGDGSTVACPCSNSAVGTMSGCLNFLGKGGRCDASGVASVGNDTLVLSGSQLPPFGSGLFYQATVLTGVVFGNGIRCGDGTSARIEIRFSDANGESATTVPVSVFGSCAAGDVRYYQEWYRDDPAACFGAGFNFTNALQITWGP